MDDAKIAELRTRLEQWARVGNDYVLTTARDALDSLASLQAERERLREAAQDVIVGHDIVVSMQGGGFKRHLEEPLWALRRVLSPGSDTANPETGHSREAITDPIERIVADGLTAAHIAWERPLNPPLDFWLPAHHTFIEVARFHTPRKIAQLGQPGARNVILIQGRAAAVAFAAMISHPERGGFADGPQGPSEGVRTEPSASRSGTATDQVARDGQLWTDAVALKDRLPASDAAIIDRLLDARINDAFRVALAELPDEPKQKPTEATSPTVGDQMPGSGRSAAMATGPAADRGSERGDSAPPPLSPSTEAVLGERIVTDAMVTAAHKASGGCLSRKQARHVLRQALLPLTTQEKPE